MPLAGIVTSAELLDLLVEVGNELDIQDGVMFNRNLMHVTYTTASGKDKVLGPTTPLAKAIAGDEIVVTSKPKATTSKAAAPKAQYLGPVNLNTCNF